MSITYTPRIAFPLGHANEYDEVVDEITSLLVSFAPDEVLPEATHDGYEPFYFGGNYPAIAAFEQGSEEFPKQMDSSPQPGAIDVAVRFYFLSITAENDFSPRAGAQKEARRMHAHFRRRLYNVEEENTTMQGRVHAVQIQGTESADLNRLGYAMAVDMDTGNYLWVHHTDIRVYL